ncbi:MAG TPA: hypothetical protein VK726_08975 [Acetobacteraceae bacterium]|nr:hypothetical protein [Acetobacteraceae bacterium]
MSLQKGPEADQVRAGPAGLVLHDWTREREDFADTAAADTAALVAALDLVITVDTAVAHLAGALGKTVWVLNRFDACWRWLERRDDSPWHPRARLFRQRVTEEWGTVVAEALRGVGAAARRRTRRARSDKV